MSNQEIISEALNLPVAERLIIVNTLVESFNPMEREIEKKWLDEVARRKIYLSEGKLDTISYSEFFGED